MHTHTVPLGEGVLSLDLPGNPVAGLLSWELERCLLSSDPELERRLIPTDPPVEEDVFLKEGLCLGRRTADGEERRL